MNCIILVGIQHSGKTTAGTLTAERFGCEFFDIDKIIEKNTGLSCRKLYAEKGPEAFKQAEREACVFLKNRLQPRRSGIENTGASGTSAGFLKAVIAAGGGICDNPRAFSVLEAMGPLIYLHAAEETAFERICARSKRTGSFPAYIEKRNPVNDAARRSIFHEVYIQRTAEYKKKAHVHIDTEGLTPYEVSRALFTAVRALYAQAEQS
ncbi:shikimate kinase [Treponema sp. HNW]|uniref:shikimate kinase n=1 Tax=Treponema sp. HNW TaxID=3116654 RepID=UPI003D0ECE4B